MRGKQPERRTWGKFIFEKFSIQVSKKLLRLLFFFLSFSQYLAQITPITPSPKDGPVAISASDLKLRPNQPDFEKPCPRNLLPSKSSRARWLLSTNTLSNRTALFTFKSSVPDSLRKPRDLVRTVCYLYRRLVLPLNLWLPSYLLNICHSFQRKVTVARDAWSIPIHEWVQILVEPAVYGSLHSTHGWPKPLMDFCRLISGLVWWLRISGS